MTEEWKPVYGYEGLYEVSSIGNVRSIGRYINSKSGSKTYREGRVISQFVTPSGYRTVCICVNGTRKTFLVHRLVAKAFLGGENETVNHKNLDKTDNRLENLEWLTYSENNKHAHASGAHAYVKLARYNEKRRKKLTLNCVENIIKSCKYGEFQKSVAEKFGVSQSLVSKIVNDKQWKKEKSEALA
jgi:hypothetical protein